jgi:hypothetical protein
VGHALRSSGFLRVEASRTRVFQFVSKLTEARRWVVHVAPSHRSCEEVKDGWVDAMDCVGPYYPCFTVFIILGLRDILFFLVFSLGL